MLAHYALIVIGGGPAGETAASIAAFFGHRSLIVERNKPGGTVTTTGGAPTKTLREAALFLTGAGSQEIYGVSIGQEPTVAFPLIRDRTDRVARFLQDHVADAFRQRGIDYLEGRARLAPGRTVHVTTPDGSELVLTADVIIIATGSRPLRPATIDFDDPDVWDSDEMFSLGRIPGDVFIVGGGPVGIEFATVFQALGARVTVADRSPRILGMMDGETAELVANHLRERGARILNGVGTESVKRVDGRLEVRMSDGSVHHPEALLFAAGRIPNSDGLGLEEAGVVTDARGRIVVDERFQTAAEGIYAAGDVVAPTQASVATEQARVAACNAFDVAFGQRFEQVAVSAVYSMPEVASVGLTEEQCHAQGIRCAIGRADFATLPRGAIAGHPGRLKLIFRVDDRRLIGAHCFGDIASELVGMAQVSMHHGGRLDDLLELAFATPTYAWAFRDAAYEAVEALATEIGGPVAVAALAREEYGASTAEAGAA